MRYIMSNKNEKKNLQSNVVSRKVTL